MTSEKPSGAEFRKKRKIFEKNIQQDANKLQKWLQTSETSTSSSNVEHPQCLSTDQMEETTKISETNENYHFVREFNETDKGPFQNSDIIENPHLDLDKANNLLPTSVTSKTSKNTPEEENPFFQINFNHPLSRPIITDKIRFVIIEHDPDQGQDADFRESKSNNGRKFSKE